MTESTRAVVPACNNRSSPRPGGFTLIELMIVVAVIAIIAAVALPSYKDSVIKGKRAQGRAAVIDLLQQQERYFTQTNSYLIFAPGQTGNNGTDSSGSTTVTIPFKTYSGDGSSTTAAYQLGASVCSNTLTLRECVMVYARPVFADPAAQDLQIQSTGLKSCNGSKTSVCWN